MVRGQDLVAVIAVISILGGAQWVILKQSAEMGERVAKLEDQTERFKEQLASTDAFRAEMRAANLLLVQEAAELQSKLALLLQQQEQQSRQQGQRR
jgi:hypothetical protein